MKHAIAILESTLATARQEEKHHTAAGRRKEANACVRLAWDCLEAVETLKLELAKRKATKQTLKTEH